MIVELCERFGFTGALARAAERAWERVGSLDYPAQRAVTMNVLQAFLEEDIAESELAGSSGYGYDDAARGAYESLLRRIFGAERALARISIASGTHAIALALRACVPRGGTLLAVAGRPYDTLRNAIYDAPDSLATSGGFAYREIALRADGTIDSNAVERELRGIERGAIFVQRSRGYATRPSLTIAELQRAFAAIRALRDDLPILVDNCYGELVEEREPTHVGADLAMGSLIKNLGGALAPTGGYCVGRADLVERIASTLYAPGLGDALGPTLGFGKAFIQGLFQAPSVVEAALRTLDFTAALFSELGYRVDPAPGSRRTDIVQAIALGSRERVLGFARGLQSVLPINARFRPEPGAVPGYRDPVVMSGGAFVAGATIELSCDAPLREPYELYVQGGVNAIHGYLGALAAARATMEATAE